MSHSAILMKEDRGKKEGEKENITTICSKNNVLLSYLLLEHKKCKSSYSISV